MKNKTITINGKTYTDKPGSKHKAAELIEAYLGQFLYMGWLIEAKEDKPKK